MQPSVSKPSSRTSLPRPSDWRLVLAGLAGLCVSIGPVVQFSFAVFLKPVAEALGTDRATISAAPSLALLLAAAATPLLGALTDRVGSRTVVLVAAPLSALAIFLVGRAPSAAVFIVAYAVAGVVATGHSPLPFVKAISARFTARRGLALGIALAGIGIGTAIMPLLAQHLITVAGWRTAYAGIAVVVLLVAWPAALALPGRDARAEAPVAMRYGLRPGEAIRCASFWMMAASFALVALAASGSIAHVVAILSDRGIAPDRAAAAVAIGGVALIGGRLLSGWLLDRVFAPHVAAVFFAATLVGVVLLLATASAGWAWVAAALLGLGVGAEIDLIAYLICRYLGQRAFGSLYGWLYTAFMVGNALGPVAMGLSFAATGSYAAALAAFAVGLAAACLLILRLGRYRFAANGEPA